MVENEIVEIKTGYAINIHEIHLLLQQRKFAYSSIAKEEDV